MRIPKFLLHTACLSLMLLSVVNYAESSTTPSCETHINHFFQTQKQNLLIQNAAEHRKILSEYQNNNITKAEAKAALQKNLQQKSDLTAPASTWAMTHSVAFLGALGLWDSRQKSAIDRIIIHLKSIKNPTQNDIAQAQDAITHLIPNYTHIEQQILLLSEIEQNLKSLRHTEKIIERTLQEKVSPIDLARYTEELKTNTTDALLDLIETIQDFQKSKLHDLNLTQAKIREFQTKKMILTLRIFKETKNTRTSSTPSMASYLNKISQSSLFRVIFGVALVATSAYIIYEYVNRIQHDLIPESAWIHALALAHGYEPFCQAYQNNPAQFKKLEKQFIPSWIKTIQSP